MKWEQWNCCGLWPTPLSLCEHRYVFQMEKGKLVTADWRAAFHYSLKLILSSTDGVKECRLWRQWWGLLTSFPLLWSEGAWDLKWSHSTNCCPGMDFHLWGKKGAIVWSLHILSCSWSPYLTWGCLWQPIQVLGKQMCPPVPCNRGFLTFSCQPGSLLYQWGFSWWKQVVCICISTVADFRSVAVATLALNQYLKVCKHLLPEGASDWYFSVYVLSK